MSLVMQLSGADFSGKVLPNINPFVALADADFAFDFRDRSSKLIDLADNRIITAYKNDIVDDQRGVVDPTVVSTTPDGLGIDVNLGYLELDSTLANIPTDGSKTFTVLVVGGYSGAVFPPEEVASSNAGTSVLFDYGSVVSGSGFTFDNGLNGDTGPRIKSSSRLAAYGLDTPDQQTVTLLTFNGSSWVYRNLTLGETLIKTNAELGLTTELVVGSINKLRMGHSHYTSTVHGLTPRLYQVAMWNRVLTETEIQDQYRRSQASFAALNL